MFSDGFIEVNNLNGDFFLKGKNSKLINENILLKQKKLMEFFQIIIINKRNYFFKCN